jgi:hypothetical protein
VDIIITFKARQDVAQVSRPSVSTNQKQTPETWELGINNGSQECATLFGTRARSHSGKARNTDRGQQIPGHQGSSFHPACETRINYPYIWFCARPAVRGIVTAQWSNIQGMSVLDPQVQE